ncbi:hypothetical protein OS493_011241 [Desmophyllum pertusum]|uniref:Uncharacterized protein n=1 Tax=Desmophyllum pertusum TaxID=174260 RepID=A0A9X0CRR7_9CNID|nr:hypothetical protein OS493_011241 [Desmophyllum pertusum]
MMRGEGTGKSGVQAVADNAANAKEAEVKTDEKDVKDAESVKHLRDDEEKNVSQSSDFDFDEVDESFCQKMRDNTSLNRPTVNNEANTPSLAREKDDTPKTHLLTAHRGTI